MVQLADLSEQCLHVCLVGRVDARLRVARERLALLKGAAAGRDHRSAQLRR